MSSMPDSFILKAGCSEEVGREAMLGGAATVTATELEGNGAAEVVAEATSGWGWDDGGGIPVCLGATCVLWIGVEGALRLAAKGTAAGGCGNNTEG